MDPILKQLQGELEAKQSEADALVRLESPTGEQLVKAEQLYDECDAIREKIDARQGELDAHDRLKARSAEIAGYRTDPDPLRATPFGGAKGGDGAREGRDFRLSGWGRDFRLSGWEPGGHVTYDPETRRIVDEVGPGIFGAKQWESMNSVEYKRDFIQYLRKGTRYLDRSKALQESLDDQGGVFSPADLIMRVVGRLAAPTRLRGLVNTVPTGRDRLEMPRKQYSADDKYTTAFRATWTGEVPASDTAAEVDMTNLLGTVAIDVHTAMLTAPVTRNLVEDSAFPMQSWLENELNEVVDLLYEDMILNGSGVGQPAGIYSNIGGTNRPEVILSGTAGAIGYDGLVDTQMAVAPQYEGNACWVMNKKSTYAALVKMVDDQHRPLFTTGYNDSGMVDARKKVLLGDPVVLSQFSPNIGAANYPVIYGDLKGYYLAQRIAFSMQVLDQTAAKRNQIELVGRVRFGGAPVEYWRLKLLKSNNS